MTQQPRPRRSVLFVPADNQRALQKITPNLAADCVIIDLEDAVSQANKASARAALPQVLADIDTGGRELLLRINACDDANYALDIALVASLTIDAVVLPKVEHAEQIEALAQALPDKVGIWAMVETARGVLNASSICDAHPKLEGLMVGTQDLGLDLKLPPGAKAGEMIDHCLMQCLIAARAAGLAAVDAVCPEFKDLGPLREQCDKAVSRGFDGKSAIHPAQLAIINDRFSPDQAQLDEAKAIVAAWDDAEAQGLSVATHNGRMIEGLHAVQARHLLAQADAISALHSS